jgi:CcmD family protein
VEQHFPYLFWAYNIIWTLIAGYLLMLGLRQRRIKREIDRLKESLKEDERA